MRQAGKNDMDLVVDIFSNTLDKNPGINWMLKKGKRHKDQIRRLAQYAFYKAYLRKGVFISSNEKGAALCFKFNYKTFSLVEIAYVLRFVITSVSLKHIPKILKLESYKRSKRPESGEYLYFWFFGVMKDGQEAGFELKNSIFQKSVKDNLPIYAETSLERNKIVYERFGFETFHYFEDDSINLKYWFMRCEPENARIHIVN